MGHPGSVRANRRAANSVLRAADRRLALAGQPATAADGTKLSDAPITRRSVRSYHYKQVRTEEALHGACIPTD